MKFLAVVSLCMMLFAIVKADGMEEAKEMLRGLAAECKKQEGANDDDVEVFINDEPPVTRTQKCLVGCMQQQFGVSDGKVFLPNGFLEVSKILMQGDEKKTEIAKEIADDCKDVTHDDRCELAVEILNCLKESAEKHGISVKH